MFDLDQFIAECLGALAESTPQLAVRDVLERTISDPAPVERALPATQAELTPLYRSPELTVLKVIWAPGMVLPPHDHRMWASIGIYGGGEDNTFFRRTSEGIVVSGSKSLGLSDTVVLGDDAIHAVTNPSQHAFTGSIHIYGGDFFDTPRSLWDPHTLEEGPADGNRMRQLFEDANARLAQQS
jgi:predicted metal-dependent enzyme (double-stranded beta helix superfamily)